MTEISANDRPPASPRSIWHTALGRLQLQVTKPNYDTWLKDTVGLACEDGVFVVGAVSDFATEWLNTRLRPLITKAVAHAAGRDLDVAFQVTGAFSPATPAVAGEAGEPATPPAGPEQLPPPSLNLTFTFTTFVVGDCNRLAHAAATAMAAGPGTLYNPLFIWGGVGLGKTHLLHAIGHEAAKAAAAVILAPAEKFTNDFVRALKANRIDAFRSRYRSADVLLVDDIQFLEGKGQTQEEFFHTFNELYAAGKRIAVTCDRSPDDLRGLDRRLCSRFQSGLLADISLPCVDTRADILRSKASTHGATVPEDVIDLLARRVPSSVRELEGSLNRIAAYARLTHQPLTLDLAAHALHVVPLPHSSSSPSPTSILAAVCSYFRVTREALTSRSRAKDVTYARHIAMYLLREDSLRSFAEIGRLLGGRDHATALYAHSRITREIENIPETRRDIEALRNDLRTAVA